MSFLCARFSVWLFLFYTYSFLFIILLPNFPDKYKRKREGYEIVPWLKMGNKNKPKHRAIKTCTIIECLMHY